MPRSRVPPLPTLVDQLLTDIVDTIESRLEHNPLLLHELTLLLDDGLRPELTRKLSLLDGAYVVIAFGSG
jgi:hypothetical protein